MILPPRKPPVSRLRVSDKVLQTFDYACVMRDFDVAARLLDILDHMAARRAQRFGGERRGDGIDLPGARERLRRAQQSELPPQTRK